MLANNVNVTMKTFKQKSIRVGRKIAYQELSQNFWELGPNDNKVNVIRKNGPD